MTVFHIAAGSVALIVSLLVTSLMMSDEPDTGQSGGQTNRILTDPGRMNA